MFDIAYSWLLLILGFNLLIGALAWRRLVTYGERLFFVFSLGGLCFYCGIGSAIDPVMPDYVFAYCCFTAVYAASFVYVLSKARRLVRRGVGAYQAIDKLSQRPSFRHVAIFVYLLVCFFPLMYPTVRLSQLWSPPSPDIGQTFNLGLTLETPLLLRFSGYVGYIVWPLYSMVLYQYRRRYITLTTLTLLPMYVQYCATSYVGRGSMMIGLVFLVGLIWLDRPNWRGRILLLSLACLPFLISFFAAYQYHRAGWEAPPQTSVGQSASTLLTVELAFPQTWQRIAYSGRNADLTAYLIWLVTLPVPKVLTGEIAGSRINYEMAEILTGVSVGQSDFNVLLSGPVTESVYIYGPVFFWVHALFVGVLGGALCALAGGCRTFTTILVQFGLAFGYVFSRAGVGGLVPLLVNSYLGLYLLLFLFVIRTQRRQAPWEQSSFQSKRKFRRSHAPQWISRPPGLNVAGENGLVDRRG